MFKILKKKNKQTCFYRENSFGPFERDENIDFWRKEKDGTRSCSFCGSLHPDDFEALLDRCLEKGDVNIDPSTNGGKWYVRRPEVKNASEGGIKFKAGHKGDAAWIERLNSKLPKCIEETRQRLFSSLPQGKNEQKKE